MAYAINDTCWACPAGFYSLAQPVFNESNALAKSNTTAGALSACQACPREAICDGGASVMGKTGWWADTSNTAGVVVWPFSALGNLHDKPFPDVSWWLLDQQPALSGFTSDSDTVVPGILRHVQMVRCKPAACGEGACTAGRSGTMCGKCSQGTGDELGR
jgi:hypothetical protein